MIGKNSSKVCVLKLNWIRADWALQSVYLQIIFIIITHNWNLINTNRYVDRSNSIPVLFLQNSGSAL